MAAHVLHAFVIILLLFLNVFENTITSEDSDDIFIENVPFRNTSLAWDERVNDLVSRLSLQDIVLQLAKGGAGIHGGPAPAIPYLDIAPYQWNTECLRGDVEAGPATSFPQAIGLAATFSARLLNKVAEATSVEVRAKNNNFTSHGHYEDHQGLSCFSPVINIMRHPLWGRNQETYGEDPYLSGRLAKAFVEGLQGDHPRYVRATAGCKHFDVHAGPENIPVRRDDFNAKVTERDWHLTFLPAFKACVRAGTYSVMCSYNRINGIPACANKRLLTDILRTDFGFTGYVVSDEGAVENIITWHHWLNNSIDTAAACINAGLNLELSGNKEDGVFTYLTKAVKMGKVSAETIQERVKPLFYTRMRLGEFDPPSMNPYKSLNLSVIQSPEHRALSVEAALSSFVLLKNYMSFLPLKTKVKQLAVIGPMADNPLQLFGDYAPQYDPQHTTTPLKGLTSLSSSVKYAAGCNDTACLSYNKSAIYEAVAHADLIIVCLGLGQILERENNDRKNFDLPGYQLRLLQDAVTLGKAPVILALFNAGPLDIAWAKQSNEIKAIIECFYPAQAAGEALRRLLLNEGRSANPAARLPATWPASMKQVPPMVDYTMDGRTYRYFKGTPLYPFGYGLSYTTFHYDLLQIMPPVVRPGEDVHVHVKVSNIGKYDGEEVVQVYLSWLNATEKMPNLQLVAFRRIFIKAHSSLPEPLQLVIQPEQMAVYIDGKGFSILPGDFVVYAGGQQPHQKTIAPSNILKGVFSIK